MPSLKAPFLSKACAHYCLAGEETLDRALLKLQSPVPVTHERVSSSPWFLPALEAQMDHVSFIFCRSVSPQFRFLPRRRQRRNLQEHYGALQLWSLAMLPLARALGTSTRTSKTLRSFCPGDPWGWSPSCGPVNTA